MSADRDHVPALLWSMLVVVLLPAVDRLPAQDLLAQELRARVSVKIVLDENGNRPTEGFYRTDAQIEEAIDASNEILAASGADWSLELTEIVDLDGVSEWAGPHSCGAAGDGLIEAIENDPALLRWNTRAINIYIADVTDCRGACNRPEDDAEGILINNSAWSISPRPLPDSSIPAESQWRLAAGYLWLHEFGHYFNLCHTQGCNSGFACGFAQDPRTPLRDNDRLNDTLPDLECWGRDDIAGYSFGAPYSEITPEEQKLVEDTILNVMSYHREAVLDAGRTVLTADQLERMAAELDPLTGGRRLAVLNLPQARFTVTGTDFHEGEAIVFDAAASTTEPGHELASYSWDFGDGSSAEGVQVEHAYAGPGLYHVRLVVEDDRGLKNLREEPLSVSGVSSSATWIALDVGEPVVGGVTQEEADCLRVAGAAGDLSIRADSFHFAHQEVTGDFEFTARVSSWHVESDGSKLGLAVREGFGEDAATVMVALEQRRGEFRHRFLTRRENGLILRISNHEIYQEPMVWLRLRRRGSEFCGELSQDGVTWQDTDSIDLPEFPERAYAGVASSWRLPDEGGASALATICDLSLTSAPPDTEPYFLRGDCDADGSACSGVNDALVLLSWLFLGKAEPPCLAACDPDGSGDLELADAVYGLNFCFRGTAAPVAPFPACGVGAQEDAALGCEASSCE